MTPLAAADTRLPSPDARGFATLGPVGRVERDGPAAVVLHAEPPAQRPGHAEAGARLRLDFLDDRTFRARLAPPGGVFAGEGSYAVDPSTRWPGPASFEVVVTEGEVTMCTPSIRVRARRDECRLVVEDVDGNILLAEEAGAAWNTAPTGGAALSLHLRPHERLFGLGDKPLSLDRRGHRLENWTTDAFKFQRGTDPLYKALPILLGIADGRSWGLFVDTTWRSEFDLGAERPDRLRVDTGGGALDYTVFTGETPLDVVRALARRTGRTPMLPRWALGYHQSRYSYRSEEEVRAVARGLRDRGFGCDALYFDIHYMDGYRVFTWDRAAFPDPARLIADLQADGIRAVVIVDPGVKADDEGYDVATEGLARGHFCVYPDGRPYVGEVWPGACYFPDFTSEDARGWWGELHAPLVEQGVAGIWNDMNEPAVFTISGMEDEAATFPPDVRHDMDGAGADHSEAHNVYGMQMARATNDALRRLAPRRRPFVITRAAYAGTQRFATTWTGDNTATWDHLQLAVQQCLSLAVSGMPFVGSDVGGFVGAPDGELFARWMQLGALTPLFRNHSAVDSPHREPWLFGDEVERVAREAIELRYRLLPYLYTALREAATDGTPIMRPLDLVHPADEVIRRSQSLGFYVGADLLAYPVLEADMREREVYLPDRPGGWFCFHRGDHIAGVTTVTTATPLEALPLYVGAGCVLPLGPATLHTAEPVDQLALHVYAGPPRWSSRLYDDAGDGWEFESGEHWTGTFFCTDQDGVLRLGCGAEGNRPPPGRTWEVYVHGLGRVPSAMSVDGRPAEFTIDGAVVRLSAAPFRELRVVRTARDGSLPGREQMTGTGAT